MIDLEIYYRISVQLIDRENWSHIHDLTDGIYATTTILPGIGRRKGGCKIAHIVIPVILI